MAKVFISYARSMRPLVERLVADLRDSGHDPFFDSKVAGGQHWWEELLGRIEQCDVFMPAISASYLESVPCRLEAEYASALNRPILPVALEPVSNRLCAPFIAEAQWITYTPSRDGILELMRGVNTLHRTPPLPNPMPPRPAVPISYLTELMSKIESTSMLSKEAQLGLVGELRSRIHGDEAADIRHLLDRLRHRHDLYQQVAVDIDALIAAGGPAPGVSSPSPSFSSPVARTPSEPPPLRQPQPLPMYQPPTQPPPLQPQPAYNAPQWPASGPSTAKPANYLVWSIVATVLCCLPIGAVGIYHSIQVDKRWSTGDYAGAARASKTARTLLIVAAAVGVVVGLLYFIAAAAAKSPS